MTDSQGKPRQSKWRRHGSRYKARRRAVDILFEAEARDMDPVAIVEDRVELARIPANEVPPVAEYTRQIVRGAAEELDALDAAITRFLSEQWELHRLPAVDRAILRMSVWELIFNLDVPAPVAVVEGVELASEYSHNQSSPYIHAVLDDVAKHREELRAEVVTDTEAGAVGAPGTTDVLIEAAHAAAAEDDAVAGTPDAVDTVQAGEAAIDTALEEK